MPGQPSTQSGIGDEVIEECAHPRGQVAALPDEDRMHLFGVARIATLQDRQQPSRCNVVAHLEGSQPREPCAGERKPPHRFAVTG